MTLIDKIKAFERSYQDIIQDKTLDSRGIDSEWGGQIMLRKILELLDHEKETLK